MSSRYYRQVLVTEDHRISIRAWVLFMHCESWCFGVMVVNTPPIKLDSSCMRFVSCFLLTKYDIGLKRQYVTLLKSIIDRIET